MIRVSNNHRLLYAKISVFIIVKGEISVEGIKELDKKRILNNKEGKINASIFITLVCMSLFIGKKNYLLFHTGIEIYSSIIAYNIFIISSNTHRIPHTGNVILLGVAYGFLGGFDILHALTYEGMGIFGYTDIDIANQLWLVARYFEASTPVSYTHLTLPTILLV